MEHTNSNSSSSAKLWTKAFILFSISNLLLFLNLQMVTPSLPTFVASELQGSDLAVSIMISAFALGAIVTRFFIGQKMAVFSRRRLLFIGLIIYTISTASYYWVHSIEFLLVIRLITGFSFGITTTLYGTIISDIVPYQRMGEGMGYFGLSTSISMSIAPLIGLWVLAEYGFQALVIAITVLVAIVIPLTAMIRFPEQAQAPVSGQAASPAQEKISALDRAVLLPCLLNLLLSINYGGIITFLALFGKEKGLVNVGWFFLFNALCVLLIRPISGKMFDRKGHMAVMPLGAACVLVGMLLLSYTSSMTMLIASALCFGLGYGMLQPSLQAWTIKRVSAASRGVANGAFYNSIDIGIAIGALCLGGIASSTSYAMMFRLSAMTMIVFLVIYGFALFYERKNGTSRKKQLGHFDDRFVS